MLLASQNTFNQCALQLLHRPSKKSNPPASPKSFVSGPQFGELQHVRSLMI